MTNKHKAPAPKPGPTPFERMVDLTRRVVAVPKTEAIKKKPKRKRH